MNKEERIAELEKRQEELAIEIENLKKQEETIFERGKFYVSIRSGVIVVCTNPLGYDGDCFSGIHISGSKGPYYLKENNSWHKNKFVPTQPVGYQSGTYDQDIYTGKLIF
jgi:hypothetical protein